MSDTYTRKGFGLKKEIEGALKDDFDSPLIEKLKASDYTMTVGQTTIKLAREYGFCYGVDRSIDYAYQTVEKFPAKTIYLTGEIIHNPFVNRRLIDKGVRFLSGPYNQGETLADVRAEDIVILPAFGVTTVLLDQLKKIGCVLVDTTCGSVLNVWKHVERFSREGFTALVHGKYYHEETLATVSRTALSENGAYIIVRDFAETELVCEYIRHGGDKQIFLERFKKCVSAGFDPDRDLSRIGVANQTTMLAGDSLQVAAMVRAALTDRYHADQIDAHYRAFDTICSATQERQDAIVSMLESGVDLSIVIGGFNSSNTINLTNIAAAYAPAYHIESAADLLNKDDVRHKPTNRSEAETVSGWLKPPPLTIGITAGASTPDSKIEEVIQTLFQLTEPESPSN